MGLYEFVSDRQYAFKVETDGIPKLVVFGDAYGSSASVFQTKDRKVAEAIRRTSMFRRGAIKETRAYGDCKASALGTWNQSR